jgi:hypothetical protein
MRIDGLLFCRLFLGGQVRNCSGGIVSVFGNALIISGTALRHKAEPIMQSVIVPKRDESIRVLGVRFHGMGCTPLLS